MAEDTEHRPLNRRELVELWTLVTTELPPVIHDDATMLRLLEDELAKRRHTAAISETQQLRDVPGDYPD